MPCSGEAIKVAPSVRAGDGGKVDAAADAAADAADAAAADATEADAAGDTTPALAETLSAAAELLCDSLAG